MKKLAILILATLLLAGCAKKPVTTTVPSAPGIEQEIRATATGHSVTLNWTQSTSPGITGNNVYRGTASGGPYNLLTSLAASTTYSDSTVTAGSVYYYVVTAVCSSCSPTESAYSNSVQATVPAGAPNPPTNLTVGPISQNQVPLQWQAPVEPPGVVLDAYLVMRGGEKTLPSPTQIATTRATNYTDTTAPRGRHYYAVKTKVTVNGITGACCRSNVAEAVVP